MKELKFIHITKTAGTSIEEVGRAKGFLWGRDHKEYGFWHVPFSTLPAALKTKYDWFLVVRNPYERILSEYYCKWGGIGSSRSRAHTKEEFNAYLLQKIGARQPSSGHYIEQYKYLDASTTQHILKFEDLPHAFNELMKTYGIDATLNVHTNARTPGVFTTADFSEELLKLINAVYARDFESFGYRVV
jgi:hypothetical protein